MEMRQVPFGTLFINVFVHRKPLYRMFSNLRVARIMGRLVDTKPLDDKTSAGWTTYGTGARTFITRASTGRGFRARTHRRSDEGSRRRRGQSLPSARAKGLPAD